MVLVALFILAAPSTAQAAVPYWSVTKVLRRIDGARIHVGTRTVRVHWETALCSGVGPSIFRAGIRKWRRFACTYATFTKAGVDRDLEFRVRVLGRIRYSIYDAHWVKGGG